MLGGLGHTPPSEKLTAPTSIEASGIVGSNAEVHPDKAVKTYQFTASEGFQNRAARQMNLFKFLMFTLTKE